MLYFFIKYFAEEEDENVTILFIVIIDKEKK